MEKLRTLQSRSYYLLNTNRTMIIDAHKEYDESIILNVTNNGGTIDFTLTDLMTNEVISFNNPTTSTYEIPLKKGNKIKLHITSSKAVGSYKIVRKTIKD